MAARKKNIDENDDDIQEVSRPTSSRKKGGNAKKNLGASLLSTIKDETMQAVLAIIFFACAFLSLLAAFGKAGPVGVAVFSLFTKLFGIGYYLIPIFFIMLGIAYLKELERRLETVKLLGATLFFISALGLTNLLPHSPGGIVGNWITSPLIRYFDIVASTAMLITVLIISIVITFETRITLDSLKIWRLFKRADEDAESEEDEDDAVMRDQNIDDASVQKALEANTLAQQEKERAVKAAQGDNPVKNNRQTIELGGEEEQSFNKGMGFTFNTKPFIPPPLTLLEKDRGKPEVGDIKANANIIKRTLANFGIDVEMDEISIGPSVTRYALKPAEGVKLSKIVGLNNDLALALAAHPIRIEAPIPGKSLVGIEIPNSTKTTVGLASLLANDEYTQSEKPLLISLGKGVTGKSYFSNLAKAPHMLIAGATGSGKSVTIHAIITSLLFRNPPDNLKFIMIDPKRVELTLYNNIPHLLTPVITDPKKAILALKWAGKEMARRYDVLEKNAVRDIESYHKNILSPALKKYKAKMGIEEDEGDETQESAEEQNTEKGTQETAPAHTSEVPETMPYIVVVIDELADIMQTYPRELESGIVRLAQMSRAVGIHLILSTQRPSVNVITGLIKANVPTRVALQVASQIDSRTILDAPGAEKLLGAGDMLYQSGDMAKPARVQSAFISETELKKVVTYLAQTYKTEINQTIALTAQEQAPNSIFSADFEADDEEISSEEDDDMYEDARAAVISAGKASTSYLQRKLGVGYSRAARLMDLLEERNVIGPANGSKPREILESGPSSSEADTSNTLPA
jgi:S-DNA-T family DNA segregation ATPase FtsK/SpoIIIE